MNLSYTNIRALNCAYGLSSVMVFESFENIQLSLWWWTSFFQSDVIVIIMILYYKHVQYTSAMKLWMCAINCLRLYTWKNNAHISHIFLYVKASMLKNFFIFIINGFYFISWFVFLYSTRKVSVTLKKGNAPSRTDREETSQVWHCPGRGDMYFSLGYNARLFGRFITLYFMLK